VEWNLISGSGLVEGGGSGAKLPTLSILPTLRAYQNGILAGAFRKPNTRGISKFGLNVGSLAPDDGGLWRAGETQGWAFNLEGKNITSNRLARGRLVLKQYK
jgi:hypothetical protein